MLITELIKLDSNFNEDMFLSYVSNIFVKLLTSVVTDDIESVKHFISDEVYTKYSNIINELNSKNLRQMYDELNVKDISISNVTIDDNYFYIDVVINSRYMDYVINKDDYKVVSGNNGSRIEVRYILNLRKKRDSFNQGIVRKCYGCGRSIDINDSGICPWCGSSYKTSDYDYILYDIKSLQKM